MLIDWFTIIAQIINFLILLWLLRRFLYGPIIQAMDKREERVVAGLKEAQERENAADQVAAQYRRKQHELDARRDQLLDEAEANAHRRRQELIEDARTEADHLAEQWHAALEDSKESFLRDLRDRTGTQVLAIARRALHDLATADLEAQIVVVFLHRLGDLDSDARATMHAALAAEQQQVQVQSAFELSSDQRRRIENSVRRQFGADVDLNFATAPELIAGITLSAGSHELAWSLQSYLETLEDAIMQSFAAETQAEADQQEQEQLSADEQQLAEQEEQVPTAGTLR